MITSIVFEQSGITDIEHLSENHTMFLIDIGNLIARVLECEHVSTKTFNCEVEPSQETPDW